MTTTMTSIAALINDSKNYYRPKRKRNIKRNRSPFTFTIAEQIKGLSILCRLLYEILYLVVQGRFAMPGLLAPGLPGTPAYPSANQDWRLIETAARADIEKLERRAAAERDPAEQRRLFEILNNVDCCP